MLIRQARNEDIPHLYTLMRDFAVFDGSDKELDMTKADLEEALFGASKKFHSLVVDIGENIIGFINYFKSFGTFKMKPTIWIEDVFIDEAFRSRGYGKALFNAVKNRAQEEGICEIEWLVRKHNKNGIDFYVNLGAEVDEEKIYVSWSFEDS